MRDEANNMRGAVSGAPPASHYRRATPFLVGALVCLAVAGSRFLGFDLWSLVHRLTPVWRNPVDLTWAGVLVLVVSSIAAIAGVVLSVFARRTTRSKSAGRLIATASYALGVLFIILYVMTWFGTAFVEAFPWQYRGPY